MAEKNNNYQESTHQLHNLLTSSDDKNTTNCLEFINTEKRIVLPIKKYNKLIICFFFFLYLFFVGISFGIFILADEIKPKLLFIIINFIFAISAILFVHLNNSKYELIKDKAKNVFKINVFNYFHCKKKSLIFNLENLYFDILTKISKTEEGNPLYSYCLAIINTFKDNSDIDLDRSNIKNVPAQIFYAIKDFKDIDSLKIFLSNQLERTNPYIIDNNCVDSIKIFGRYRLEKNIQLTENFFSFFFRKSDNYKILIGILICLESLCLAISFSLIIADNGIYLIIIAFSIIIFFIILNILFFFIKLNSIKRMDIIFSNNYDRIFIGFVKLF